MAGFQQVEVNGEIVEFPSDMSDEDIAKALSGDMIPSNDPAVPTKGQTPVDFKEVASRPEPYTVNPKAIGLAGVVGSVLGGAWLKLAKTGGSATVAALEGGVTGAGSAAVGELIKEATNNSNVGQLTALGAELITGAALPLTRDVITRVPTAALMASVGYAKAKTAQALTGESASSRIAKDKIFGTEVVKGGVAKTNYKEAFEEATSKEMADAFGIVVPDGTKAQDAIRQTLYNNIDTLDQQGVPFLKTPAGTDLMKRLNLGVSDGTVKEADVKTIGRLLTSQFSPEKATRGSFSERLLNTAQQATKEYNGVKISDGAADILKEAIDGYVGKPYYKTLKSVEKQRFTAQAMDDIPVLLDKGFSGENVEQALVNLARNPEGKKNFQVALSSYIRGLPEKQALSEWNRLYESGILTRSKVMDTGDLLSMNRKVKQYTEKGYIKKAGDITGHALKMSIITGILPAEGSSRVVDIFHL